MAEFFKKVFGRQSEEDHVPSFNDQPEKTEEVKFIDHGIQTVDLKKIIGSVGKYHDFDSRFRPKKHVAGKRFFDIKKAMREGKVFPPVKLYQIRDDYYVFDGNHRVAAAKELGQFDIRASVVELLSSKKTMENLLYIERKKFYEKTGLPDTIKVTEVGKYRYLEKQIDQHQKYLVNISGKDVDYRQSATDWYDTIYTPLTTLIKNGNLLKYFPKRTEADLYNYISYHHWEGNEHRRYGIGIDRLIPRDMEAFRSVMLEKDTPEYPEMKRSITVFILITLYAGSQKVLERLYELEEVQEVHAVHGNIDLIVKAVLKRDLLASDAEIISEFVDLHVRKISGIERTQTLIPGISKVKEGFVC